MIKLTRHAAKGTYIAVWPSDSDDQTSSAENPHNPPQGGITLVIQEGKSLNLQLTQYETLTMIALLCEALAITAK